MKLTCDRCGTHGLPKPGWRIVKVRITHWMLCPKCLESLDKWLRTNLSGSKADGTHENHGQDTG